jgi:hypothetical protein
MATTSGTFNFYDSFVEKVADGTIDMDDATAGYFKVALTTSSYTPSASTHTVIGDITNEVSGNGYARASVGNISFTESGGTATFDGDDATFTASGGSIVARYWVLFADGATGDPLIAYGLLDDTPGDVTTTDGNTLTVEWSGSGILTLAKA